ncbi:MAG: preprotein translocase subunit YajC [Clostridia bacterium]|nr:preprotein translocase subunit YajC [Clostridia bacterium]
MINFICAEQSNNVVFSVIIIVALLGMLIFPYFTQRKKNKEYVDMLNSIKVGDLVKTAGGIIGKINKITDKGDIKTVILETGSKTEKSYMEFDMSMIYCVLKSTKAAETAEETPVEEVKAEEEKVEAPVEAPVETPVEEKTEAPKKTAAKKTTSTKKSTTAKKSTTKKK